MPQQVDVECPEADHQADLAYHFPPTVTIRGTCRRWPCADWRDHTERTGASVRMVETLHRNGAQQPTLAMSVAPTLMANVGKAPGVRACSGVGPLTRPDHLTQQDVGAR